MGSTLECIRRMQVKSVETLYKLTRHRKAATSEVVGIPSLLTQGGQKRLLRLSD